MTLTLTVLGSGVALPSARRGCPGYLLQVGESHLALDFGAGSMRRLAELGLPAHRLDALALSHAHIDHTGDLLPLLFARRNPDLKTIRPLSIYAWQGFAAQLDGLRAVYGRWIEPRHSPYSVTELSDAPVRGPGWRLLSREVDHIPGARALRVESDDGVSVCYSGDTDSCEAIVELGAGADLLILECSFPDDQKVAGHLTPRECGEIARRAQPGALMLSHFYPPCDEVDVAAACREAWSGTLLLAEDGMSWSP